MFLGELVDPASHKRNGTRVDLDPASLTTHGVIVGQTGSGKTGLGIDLIEEALDAGIPAILIDPKGDLGNLCLMFPGLSESEFAPWVEGIDAPTAAQQWKDGLASWGIDGARIAALKQKATFTIYTPGSSGGVGLNLIGSLQPPAGLSDDADARVDEIGSVVSGLLALLGIESDPLSGQEHILLTNLIDRAWAGGQALDLSTLIAQVQQPPMRKLGVLELDTFYPPKDRITLAMKLNGLAASPSFAAWAEGVPLDIDAMLWDNGKPRCAIVNIAQLSDEERQFAVSVILGRLLSWVRKQSGTSKLRALIYFDEVFGFVPPTAEPPTKRPILTLLKQARAFGVGLVLATQNPVDVDYKALSNAATWIVGRLQTERDKDRLLDGMRSAAGGVDVDTLNATISGLAKREFVLHQAGSPAPKVFTTRWTMSYLRGPLTREQIDKVMAGAPLPSNGVAPTSAPAGVAPAATAMSVGSAVATAAPAASLSDDEVPVVPPIAKGTPVYFLDPAAPWADRVQAAPGATRHEGYLAARVSLLFDDEKAGLREQSEWEALFPLDGEINPADAITVDYDARDFLAAPPEGSTFVLPSVAVAQTSWFTGAKKAITDHLVASTTLTLQHNAALKLFGRVDETEEAFLLRCDAAAQDKADAETAKIRTTLESKVDRLRDQIAEAERQQEIAKHQEKSAKTNEIISGAGALLGALLGGRKNTRSIVRSVGSAASARGRTSTSSARAGNAAEKVAERQQNLEELERQLAEQLGEIDAKWDDVARQVTTLDVTLEKTDVRVTELAVVWVPKAF